MTTRRRRPPSRSRGRTRRRVGWPWWVRLLVGGLAVAAVVFAVLWFDALPGWVKAASIAAAALAVALWWLWTRRAEIAAEMRRRETDQRTGHQPGSGSTAGGPR
jgi:hypothetical protein